MASSRADRTAKVGGHVNLDGLPPTISVETAGRILGIGRSSAYQAARTGELPTIPLGRRLVVPTAKLRALLEPNGDAA